MTNPLSGARLRHSRATKHLTDLEELLGLVRKTYADGVPAYEDPETGRVLAREISEIRDAEEMISVHAGEIVYNLRAALDYLVYVLAEYDSGEIQDDTQFPIESCPNVFERRRKTRLKGVSDEHVAIIEQYQPFKGCKWTAVLREISNEDKHRRLVSAITTFDGERVLRVTVDPIAEAQWDASEKAMHVYVQGTADIAFSNGLPIAQTLKDLHSEVGFLLTSFMSEFEWMQP